MVPVSEAVTWLTVVRRIGGATNPPRFPRELISPMPAAAAVPVRNAVGYDQQMGGPVDRKLHTARVMKMMPTAGIWFAPAHAEPKMQRPVEMNNAVPPTAAAFHSVGSFADEVASEDAEEPRDRGQESNGDTHLLTGQLRHLLWQVERHAVDRDLQAEVDDGEVPDPAVAHGCQDATGGTRFFLHGVLQCHDIGQCPFLFLGKELGVLGGC